METEVKTNNVFFIFTLTSEMYFIIPDDYLLISLILSHVDSFLEFTNILYLLSYLILATVLTDTLKGYRVKGYRYRVRVKAQRGEVTCPRSHSS